MDMASPFYFVRGLLVQLPLLAAYLAVFIVMLVRWRKHPTSSLLTVTAVAILTFLLLWRSVEGWLFDRFFGFQEIIFWGLAFIANLAEAGAVILLLFAIIKGRANGGPPWQQPSPRRPAEGQQIMDVEPVPPGEQSIQSS